jgi:methylthioribose-1-phosphate isomerase
LGIPTNLIVDSAAGSLMQQGEIQAVIVGADRIAANGDVANKIGTYTLAILAKEHAIPFYVAAPVSTFDLLTSSGQAIHIEERNPDEVTHWAGKSIAPIGINVKNQAFDITPHGYIAAFMTEQGILRPPYATKIRDLKSSEGLEVIS